MGRVLFLREYASFISDAMITELMDYPRNMMLSIDIIPVAMDEAVSDIRKRIMSVESDITRWQQRVVRVRVASMRLRPRGSTVFSASSC